MPETKCLDDYLKHARASCSRAFARSGRSLCEATTRTRNDAAAIAGASPNAAAANRSGGVASPNACGGDTTRPGACGPSPVVPSRAGPSHVHARVRLRGHARRRDRP
jgi:hypothetical protein